MHSKLEHPAFLAVLGLTGLLIGAFSRSEPVGSPPAGANRGQGGQNRATRAGKPSSLPARSWWSVIKGVASHVGEVRAIVFVT